MMAIFNVFKRKKKVPDYYEVTPPAEMGAYGPAGYPAPGVPAEPAMPAPGMEFAGMAPAPQAAPSEIENIRQQMEALNYKLDTLKAVLDSIHTKLDNIEAAMKVSPGGKGEGW